MGFEDRLATIAPDLVQLLRKSSAADLRRIATAVATFAVEQSGLADPIITDGLRALAESQLFGPTRRAVETLSSSLDEEYFDLKEAGERGDAPQDAYRAVFHRARAASAVFYALSSDPFQAAAEAIYEAKAATQDLDAIRKAVRDHRTEH